MKNIAMIAAVTSQERAIGKENGLLFHIPEDLAYFKEVTQGHTLVMGYQTYMSLPKRPLPGRKNIVLSKNHTEAEGGQILSSVEAVLDYAREHADEKIFICGGASLYEQFMEHADNLYITWIDKEEEGADRFFPPVREDEWDPKTIRKGSETEECGIHYIFAVYEREKK